jgi:hypothetical protein
VAVTAQFQKPAEDVQKAAVGTLIANGFQIKKADRLYAEGVRSAPDQGGKGEIVGIWLDDMAEGRTKVTISTIAAPIKDAGQKNFNDQILAGMEQVLGAKD